MGEYNFTYEIPSNFESRIRQFLQSQRREDLYTAFQRCKYEHNDCGYAYYAGMKGDNWNKKALDFIIEGAENDIRLLESSQMIFKDILEKSLKPSESGYLVRNISFLLSDEGINPFAISNEERFNFDMSSAKDIFKDLVLIGERLCINAAFDETSKENTINDYVRDMLCYKGYAEVKDQTRHGISSNGKDAGEVDILLTKDNKEVALFEGIIPHSATDKRIGEHIEKAVTKYNPLGTPAFIVAYVKTNNFIDFWKHYYNYISNYNYNMNIKKSMMELGAPNASTKCSQIILSKDGFDFPVFFICFKINNN